MYVMKLPKSSFYSNIDKVYSVPVSVFPYRTKCSITVCFGYYPSGRVKIVVLSRADLFTGNSSDMLKDVIFDSIKGFFNCPNVAVLLEPSLIYDIYGMTRRCI